ARRARRHRRYHASRRIQRDLRAERLLAGAPDRFAAGFRILVARELRRAAARDLGDRAKRLASALSGESDEEGRELTEVGDTPANVWIGNDSWSQNLHGRHPELSRRCQLVVRPISNDEHLSRIE